MSIFATIQKFRDTNFLCDFTINVKNKTWKVHKLILAASSNYFRLLFESNDGKIQDKVNIKTIKQDAFQICLDHMYQKDIQLKYAECWQVIHAAKLFELDELLRKCSSLIKANLNSQNCVEVFELSCQRQLPEVQEAAKKCVCKNANEVLADEEVLKKMDAAVMEMIVKSEEINVTEESVIFEAMITWTEFDIENRREYFCELIKFVRLPTLSSEYLAEHVISSRHFVQGCTHCGQYFRESIAYALDKKKRNLMDYQRRERSCLSSPCRPTLNDLKQRQETIPQQQPQSASAIHLKQGAEKYYPPSTVAFSQHQSAPIYGNTWNAQATNYNNPQQPLDIISPSVCNARTKCNQLSSAPRNNNSFL